MELFKWPSFNNAQEIWGFVVNAVFLLAMIVIWIRMFIVRFRYLTVGRRERARAWAKKFAASEWQLVDRFDIFSSRETPIKVTMLVSSERFGTGERWQVEFPGNHPSCQQILELERYDFASFDFLENPLPKVSSLEPCAYLQLRPRP
jgi:hypothetical protein